MVTIRDAKPEDANAILEIYGPIVRDTPISFELDVPTEEEMKSRISAILNSHAWLVADTGNSLLGYAYASTFRPRKAYRFSAEVTVYVQETSHRSGIGQSLYTSLFSRLADRGFRTALAGICLPNDASIALHKNLGFQSVGTFRDVGYKFEKWHDVEWWQKPLNPS